MSKGGGLGEEGSRADVAAEKATGSRSSDRGYVEWKIEVLVIRSCPMTPNIKQACLVKASLEQAEQEPRYKGEDERLIRQGNDQMWVYHTTLFSGHPEKAKHKKASVLEQAVVVVESNTNLVAEQAKVKKILVQKENEGMQPPERVYTALYTYECTREEMQDKRWGLRGEDELAGNPIGRTIDAVWVPLHMAYGLTEMCPEVMMPESFRTGMVASYIAAEKVAVTKKAEAIRDSARRNHPKLYPPNWNIALEQQVITGTLVKVWVKNLERDAAGSCQVAIYKNAKGEWRTPEGYREEREGHRQAASRIASEQLGIRILAESWQHLGEGIERHNSAELGLLSGGNQAT